MYTGISGAGGFWLLLNRARGRKNMLVSLITSSVYKSMHSVSRTHGNKEVTTEQAIPWVFGVIVITLVHKNRPLVSRHGHLPTT
jgi:hypothetical protein